MSSEQLSKQDHYDFGMRAVKSVLVMAGHLKRNSPDLDESELLIRAMRDSNIPKFLSHDLPLFSGIVSDLFPGITVSPVDVGKLAGAINETLVSNNFTAVDTYVEKVLQLHATTLVRHGIMVVGAAACGKSNLVEILAKAMTNLNTNNVSGYSKVDKFVLNPKAVTMGELYGQFTNGEWADGLIAKLVRDACVDDGAKKWIVLKCFFH